MQTNLNNSTNMLPLMMNYTIPSHIEEDTDPISVRYDDINQVTIEMRIVGTRSLRSHTTRKKLCHTTDRKNEIDDTKSVR